MAKATRYFCGTDTFGRSVEVCESASGVFFSRTDIRTQYGLQTTKWQAHSPEWSYTVTNAYSGVESVREAPVMSWGFSVLAEAPDMEGIRFRLPF